MITVGIDDTDIIDSPGTNQLARAIVRAATEGWRCIRIVRHQLLYDPRVPYTSKNGSASIMLAPRNGASVASLLETCRKTMRDWYVEGSDPGLCIVTDVPPAVVNFGRRCKTDLMVQAEARDLAAEHGLHLEGLGGTEGGVIGALAAVGLADTEDDGRIVQIGEWPDDLSGFQSHAILQERQVDVRDLETGDLIHQGLVDVGKHLRPNLRGGRSVVFVCRLEASGCSENLYEAIRLT